MLKKFLFKNFSALNVFLWPVHDVQITRESPNYRIGLRSPDSEQERGPNGPRFLFCEKKALACSTP